MKPKEAINANKARGEYTDYLLYKAINDNPGKCIYSIAKRVGWRYGKVQKTVERLEKRGLIKARQEVVGNRAQKQIFPVEAYHLLSKETHRYLEEEIRGRFITTRIRQPQRLELFSAREKILKIFPPVISIHECY